MAAPPNAEYDLIFAGGGTAACLIASRLATADPTLKILVLEAGLHTKDQLSHTQPARVFSHTQPARFPSHLAPASQTVTFNIGNPAAEIGGRHLVTPSARCVGGGSSVNFMVYSRAMASDYDDWETVHGNTGWSSEDLIPLMQKTETYQVGNGKLTHGYSGPLKVSHGGTYTNVGKQFLDVAVEYDKKRGSTDDINSMMTSTSINKYGRQEKWIDADSGKRSDVPHHFIYNADHKNLTVLDGKRVKRVVFEGTRAVGVEYTNDIISKPESDQTLETVQASKIVVISAGTFGSSTILERSGIGAKNILKEVGVEPLVDLPGVGENYQDHNIVFVPYLADDEADTLDALFQGDKDEVDRWAALWTMEGKGLLAHNGVDAGVKLRPSAEELNDELGSQFSRRWAEHFANAPDKPVIWMGPASAYLGDPSVASARKYYCMGYYTQYPVSRGSVHIKSADDPHAAPDFNPGFLRDEADIATLRWGYKKSREIARRMGLYRGEFVPGNPSFPADSAALCGAATGPVGIEALDIPYTAADDKVIETYHRNFVQTAWHSLGTCSMRQREKGGVVDSHLNVYGVQGLKVADLSVAPSNVAANTYSTTLTIGEKAAIIIAEELGIKVIQP